MVERNTIARIFIILGAILQLIYLVTNGFFGFIIFVIIILGSIFTPGDPLLDLATTTMAWMFLTVVLGFIFMIIWFVMASMPGRSRIWLIITGLLALFLCGLIPGFLAFTLFGTTWPPFWLGLILSSWLPGLLVFIAGIVATKPLEA